MELLTHLAPSRDDFLKTALACFAPDQVVAFFADQGVPCKIESTGKVFPESDRAIDVRDALVRHARECGAEIIKSTAVVRFEKQESGFRIMTEQGEFGCQSLVVTTGGKSFPGCGTVGDGYAWLKTLGHTIEAPRPALTPIRVTDPWVRELSGVTISDAALSIEPDPVALAKAISAGYQVIRSGRSRSNKKRVWSDGVFERGRDRGSFLFTHFGCSGPAPMNVSRAITDPAHPYGKHLICDWLPGMDEHLLRDGWLAPGKRQGGVTMSLWLSDHMPKRLATAICVQADVASEAPLAELKKSEVMAMLLQVKRCPLTVNGTLGFAKAEVTSGGVALTEVDPKRMESKRVAGLFLAGEILDVDGPIGGYNFQAAFCTGRLAGQYA